MYQLVWSDKTPRGWEKMTMHIAGENGRTKCGVHIGYGWRKGASNSPGNCDKCKERLERP